MSRRMLNAGLALAVLLGLAAWTGRIAAKPPDLPLVDKNTLAAQPNPMPAQAPAMPAPFFHIRPSSRNLMASCLLFGIHPLLTLAPMDQYIDFDDDDPPELPVVFMAPPVQQPAHGTLVIGIGVSSDAGLTGSITFTPSPADSADGEHNGQADGSTPRLAPIPADMLESICPWMRLQEGNPTRCAPPSPDELSHDVLHNLETLHHAQTLLQTARELGRSGHVSEALQILDVAHGLCPGSSLDDAVRQALAELSGKAPARMAELEHDIERKLMQPVSVAFDRTPLHQVIDNLQELCGLNICVDKAALEAQEISLDRQVTVKLTSLSLKSTLSLLLKDADLTYIIKDGLLQITTREAARGQMTPVAYQVADLLEGDLIYPGAAGESESKSPGETLIKIITTSVSPNAWSVNGGPGAIDYHPLTHSLVIHQTADVQEQVAELLYVLRRQQKPHSEEPEERCTGFHLEAVPSEPEDAPPTEPITPCLPPVDPNTPADLDGLYGESLQSSNEGVHAASGGAKPMMRLTSWLGSVAAGKDAGAGESSVEAWKEMLDAMGGTAHGEVEIGLGVTGFQMFTQFRRGGSVWHMAYRDGALSVWASPPVETEPMTEEAGDDSGDD